MKRKLAIILVLAMVMVMVFSGCTDTESMYRMQMLISYRDNEIGGVTRTPMTQDGELMPCGINVVRFVFDRPSVILREGKVTIYNYDDDTIFQEFVIEAGDTEYEGMNIFSDPDTNGSVFEFGLETMFNPGSKYYIEATEGLFGVDGEAFTDIFSPAYGGKDEWNVEIAPFGISGFDGPLEKIGDKRTFDVVVGGDVTEVKITEEDDDIATIEPEVLTESGKVTVTVDNTGYSVVTFSFQNADGEQIQQLQAGVFIEDPTEKK